MAKQRSGTVSWVAWGGIGLIVLTILLLLFGGPIINRPHRQQRSVTTVCVNNLKSTALSLIMYADDNGGRLPVVAPGQEDTWVIAAAAYSPVVGVRWCPSDPQVGKIRDLLSGSATPAATFQQIRRRVGVASSYRLNPKLSGAKLSDIKNANTVVLLEETGDHHQGYHLVAYADGSAKALKK